MVRVYLLVVLFVVGSSAVRQTHIRPEAVVDFVNTRQSLWKAEVKDRPIESIAKKLMDVKYTQLPEGTVEGPEMKIDEATIPDSFDARTQWPTCQGIGFIRDQSDCGSCWAFGAAEAMSDRLCISTKGATNLKLSADDLLSCCGKSCGNGCEGGYPIDAWKYWVKTGLVTGGLYGDTTTCRPYEIPPCGHHPNQTYYGPCPDQEYDTPTCKQQCVSGYSKSYVDDKHFGSSAYSISKKIASIQTEIMTNGPIEAAYTVYEDFYYYKSGVYVHTFGAALGGHAVKILGWGVDNGTPYWLVANSWNTDWGENGFFRIIRGVNECGIEGGLVAGLPKN